MATPFFKRRSSIAAVFFIAAVLGLVLSWWLPHRSPTAAPDANFTLLEGGTQTLRALRGRVVLVNFWSPSCPPCLEELPDLIALHRDWQAKGLTLIGVAAPYDPPLGVQQFVAREKIPYPIALDVDGAVMRAFGGVPYLPLSLVIDPAGTIVFQHTGRLDRERVQRVVQGYLGGSGT
jgi:thiol-disulfide isomerase/thioredoxin